MTDRQMDASVCQRCRQVTTLCRCGTYPMKDPREYADGGGWLGAAYTKVHRGVIDVLHRDVCGRLDDAKAEIAALRERLATASRLARDTADAADEMVKGEDGRGG